MTRKIAVALAFLAASVADWAALAAPDGGPAPAPAAAPADAGAVPAPALPDPEADGMGFLKTIVDAAMSRNWAWLAALALVAVVWALRRFAGGKLPWLKTDRGGAVLVLATSVVGALATSLGAGKALGGEVVLQAVYVGFMAAGGFTWLKRMLGHKASP